MSKVELYRSKYSGETVDEAIGKIASGEIEKAVERAEDAAERAESSSENVPYVGDNDTWMIWNPIKETYEDSGISAKGKTPKLTVDKNGHLIVNYD